MMPAYDPGTAASCSGCVATTGVQRTTSVGEVVQAWSCAMCGMTWAITVVNPHLRAAYPAGAVEEIGRLRRALRQVITLADDAPTITDRQLRDRLLTLAAYAR